MIELESTKINSSQLAANVDEFVSQEVKEEFHQFRRNTGK